MRADRGSMRWMDADVPAPWAKSVATRPPGPGKRARRRIRRSWPSRSGASSRPSTGCGSSRRRTAAPGEVGRLLRREGLYTSHLSGWRKARRNGSLQGLTPKKRGAKPAEPNPLSAKVRALEAKVAWLEKELATAHTILDVQGKVAGLLEFRLSDGKNC